MHYTQDSGEEGMHMRSLSMIGYSCQCSPVRCCLAEISPGLGRHIWFLKEDVSVSVKQPDLLHMVLDLNDLTACILVLPCGSCPE